jgi:nucleotide-binding universal stress UspA family protein
MKRILVPCDFSPPAIEAFKFAASIAADSGGAIWLLHAHELPVLHDFESVKGFESRYRNQLRDIADKNFSRLLIKVPYHVKVNTVIDFGPLGRALTKSLKTVKPDVVVVGTHGASGLKELIVGSNAEKIVRNSPIPVITVRKAPRSVEDIVFAFRPDKDSDDLTLRVKKLQSFFHAKLHMVYVNTPTHFTRDADIKPIMNQFAKRAAFKNVTINTVSDLYEADGIIHFANEIGADLVAMRTHGRRGFAHLANGSIAENVVNHITCPIWTYRVTGE